MALKKCFLTVARCRLRTTRAPARLGQTRKASSSSTTPPDKSPNLLDVALGEKSAGPDIRFSLSAMLDRIDGRRKRDLDPRTSLTETTTQRPHHLNILTHKHNTHVTFTRPNREPILSVSVGNIGIRKSRRGLFDSGYQLMAYALKKMREQGLMMDVEGIELVFRGFGKGREAVEKALMGSEGRFLRQKIIRVTDSTRVKIGGQRGRNPRRL